MTRSNRQPRVPRVARQDGCLAVTTGDVVPGRMGWGDPLSAGAATSEDAAVAQLSNPEDRPRHDAGQRLR